MQALENLLCNLWEKYDMIFHPLRAGLIQNFIDLCSSNLE